MTHQKEIKHVLSYLRNNPYVRGVQKSTHEAVITFMTTVIYSIIEYLDYHHDAKFKLSYVRKSNIYHVTITFI